MAGRLRPHIGRRRIETLTPKSTAALRTGRVPWIVLVAPTPGLFTAGILQQQRNFTRGARGFYTAHNAVQ